MHPFITEVVAADRRRRFLAEAAAQRQRPSWKPRLRHALAIRTRRPRIAAPVGPAAVPVRPC